MDKARATTPSGSDYHDAGRRGRENPAAACGALWWYHFFDAAVVEQLIRDSVITVPTAGYAAMIVVPG